MATELTEMINNFRENKSMDDHLADSSVSLKLSLIQKRCAELMNETDGLDLSLEDSELGRTSDDPYTRLK